MEQWRKELEALGEKYSIEAPNRTSRDVADELVDAFLNNSVVTSAAFHLELTLRLLPRVSVESLSELVNDLQYSSCLVWSVGNKAEATNQQLLEVCMHACMHAYVRLCTC